jgi:hypothetical protein
MSICKANCNLRIEHLERELNLSKAGEDRLQQIVESMGEDNDKLKKEVEAMDRLAISRGEDCEKLVDALSTIVKEYNNPPYTEFDWFAWKQKAEKAIKSLGLEDGK